MPGHRFSRCSRASHWLCGLRRASWRHVGQPMATGKTWKNRGDLMWFSCPWKRYGPWTFEDVTFKRRCHIQAALRISKLSYQLSSACFRCPCLSWTGPKGSQRGPKGSKGASALRWTLWRLAVIKWLSPGCIEFWLWKIGLRTFWTMKSSWIMSSPTSLKGNLQELRIFGVKPLSPVVLDLCCMVCPGYTLPTRIPLKPMLVE